MTQKLVTITGQLTTVSEIVSLAIPNHSITQALRLDNKGSQIRIVMLMEDDTITSTHFRAFSMTPDGDVPANFVKFIGQRMLNSQLVNIIEVTAPSGTEAHHSMTVEVADLTDKVV